jgi:enoyl-CoA hydratase
MTIATTKFIIGEVVKDESERDLAKCAAMVKKCFESTDYTEGRRAFMEKRQPLFMGR